MTATAPLSVVVYPGGQTERLAEDNALAENIPAGLEFTTQIPGGFGTATFTLPHDPARGRSRPDVLNAATIYGPGGEVVFDGYVSERPAGDTELTISLVGWQGALKWPTGFRETYVHSDFGDWRSPTTTRNIDLLAASYRGEGPTIELDATGSALVCKQVGSWAATHMPAIEGALDCQAIGSIYYAWSRGANINPAFTSWSWMVYAVGTADITGDRENTANLRASGPGSGTLTVSASNFRHAMVQLSYSGGATDAENYEYALRWTALAVYGRHGLTKVGSGSATTWPGLYAHEIAADIVQRAAPQLTATIGTDVEVDHGAVVKHLSFHKQPVTAEEALLELNKPFGKVFGIYEGRRFFWRSRRSPARRWRARIADGAKLSVVGRQAEDAINAVWVTYQDAAGAERSVGPPGSGADVTDSLLEDTSPTNPVNANGWGRKWAHASDLGTADSTAAVAYGRAVLADATAKALRGEVEIVGTIADGGGALHPVWSVRAGDELSVTDAADATTGTVISTSYSHDRLVLRASIDTTPHRAEVLLALLQAQAG